jgi:thermitase
MNIVPLGLRCFFVFTSIVLVIPVSALVMGENGPEPVIVQLKESVRKSDSLDAELTSLAATQRLHGVQVERRWVGPKYLERVAFPKSFSKEQALAAIQTLERLPCVEKVVPASAFNLEFRAGDFVRSYSPDDKIPEPAMRGLDAHRLNRGDSLPAVPDLTAPHKPNRLIVSWKPEQVWRGERTGFGQRIAQMHASAGCRVVKAFRWSETELVEVLEFDPRTGPLWARLQRYLASDWVEYAQPDYAQSSFARVQPNDPSFQSQRATLDVIRAPEAWSMTTGSEAWTIAVADSTSLAGPTDLTSTWGNFSPASRSFYDSYGNPSGGDDHSINHGTRVASIVGAQSNNGIQMAGVAWDIKVMHLKVAGRYLDEAEDPPVIRYEYSSSAAAEAIGWAWNPSNPADKAIAINLSFGDPVPLSFYNSAERQALNAARNNGNILAICAAGNDGAGFGNGADLDAPNKLVSPACIPTDNVLSVGGTNSTDNGRATASNYGRYQIDLGAPSVSVLSLTAGGTVSSQTGNSFSAPQVTGTVGLIKTKYPWESYLGLRDRVLMGTEDKAGLVSVFRTGGRLNAEKALLRRTLIQNLSTRARVEGGERVMVGGFVVGGSMQIAGAPTPPPLKVAIRGLGPSVDVGVARLGNPKITLRQGSTVRDSNDNWQSHPTAAELQSRNLQPASALEAALIITLEPGTYTVVLEDAGTAYGVGVFELYELENATNQQTRLLNVSTRCLVGTGDNQAIAGAIVGSSEPRLSLPPDNVERLTLAQVPKRRILMLGNGPTLGALGVSGFLPNPFLQLANSAAQIIGTNDRWEDIDGTSIGLQSELTENGWRGAPSSENYRPDEAALWPTFSAGSSFTAILGPAGGSGEGIGLIEFYEY